MALKKCLTFEDSKYEKYRRYMLNNRDSFSYPQCFISLFLNNKTEDYVISTFMLDFFKKIM